MLKYVLSPQAEDDLDKIWEYSAYTWSATQAEKYFDQIIDAIILLTKESKAGKSIDYVAPGYRKFSVKSHLIIYKILDDSIDVIRILHERMDIDERLKE